MGTALGWLTRSIPVCLGIGVLWAGPIENAIGEDIAFGRRWFPGLMLRYLVCGRATWPPPRWPPRSAPTVAVLGVTALAVTRRDVTR